MPKTKKKRGSSLVLLTLEINSTVMFRSTALIRSNLNTYTMNLVDKLKSQYPNADIKDIIGGRSIQPQTITQLPTETPFTSTVNQQFPLGQTV